MQTVRRRNAWLKVHATRKMSRAKGVRNKGLKLGLLVLLAYSCSYILTLLVRRQLHGYLDVPPLVQENIDMGRIMRHQQRLPVALPVEPVLPGRGIMEAAVSAITTNQDTVMAAEKELNLAPNPDGPHSSNDFLDDVDTTTSVAMTTSTRNQTIRWRGGGFPHGELTEDPAVKTILYWNNMFTSRDYRFGVGHYPFVVNGCPVSTCQTTWNRTWLDRASVVLFHGPWIDEKGPLPDYRPPGQLYYLILNEPQSIISKQVRGDVACDVTACTWHNKSVG